MEYHGKLYGRFGNKYFDTGKTSKDFDEMFEMLKELSKHHQGGHSEIGFKIKELITKISEK